MAHSLWSKYIAELKGGTTNFFEEEWGFISYSFPEGDSVYVEDIYVMPEYRNAYRALDLLGRVETAAKGRGKTHSLFVVTCGLSGAAKNLRTYLAMGFEPVVADSGKIWLKRAFKGVG